jgi:hypothetical protein
MMRALGKTDDPRDRTIEDVKRSVSDFQDQGHSVVLSWDANETTTQDGRDSGVNQVLFECGLVDVHFAKHPSLEPPATHCNGSTQIEYVFISPELLPSITATSILEFHTGYTSDHRALIVDFDPKRLFGSATANIEKHTRRKLTSTNPCTMERYINHIRKAFQSNQIAARVQRLHLS